MGAITALPYAEGRCYQNQTLKAPAPTASLKNYPSIKVFSHPIRFHSISADPQTSTTVHQSHKPSVHGSDSNETVDIQMSRPGE